MKKIEIIAHRGARGPFMENTFEAFNRVAKLGVRAIEMDVRLDYKNQRFFLEHDFIHHPKYRQNLLSKVIPSLPKNLLHIVELKTFAWTKLYVTKFKRTFDELFVNRRTVVISFNFIILFRLKQVAPYIPRGYIMRSKYKNFFFKLFLHKWLKPKCYIIHRRLLKEKSIKWARKHNYKIYVYPLNSEKSWEFAITKDIDGMITDYPLLLKKFLDKNKHRKYFI
jgi:glycerophosphoryl diester phosphodiesterase